MSKKNDLELIYEMRLSGSKPTSTSLEFNDKLTSADYDRCINVNKDDKLLFEDSGKYQRLVGRLLYLTMSRQDIAFVVQVLSQFMHSPKQSHMDATLGVVRYIKGTTGLGLFMPSKTNKELVARCVSD